MNIAQMLEQSGILTLLGMCVVFTFLIIMIGAMNLLHGIIHLFKLLSSVGISIFTKLCSLPHLLIKHCNQPPKKLP